MKTITFILFSIISVNCFAQQFIAEVNWSYLSCHGNDASACVSVVLLGGTPPYNYAWSTGATTTAITGLSAGTYSVCVYDFYLYCFYCDTVTLAPILIVNCSGTNIKCNGGTDGTITVTAAIGTPPYAGTGT